MACAPASRTQANEVWFASALHQGCRSGFKNTQHNRGNGLKRFKVGRLFIHTSSGLAPQLTREPCRQQGWKGCKLRVGFGALGQRDHEVFRNWMRLRRPPKFQNFSVNLFGRSHRDYRAMAKAFGMGDASSARNPCPDRSSSHRECTLHRNVTLVSSWLCNPDKYEHPCTGQCCSLVNADLSFSAALGSWRVWPSATPGFESPKAT